LKNNGLRILFFYFNWFCTLFLFANFSIYFSFILAWFKRILERYKSLDRKKRKRKRKEEKKKAQKEEKKLSRGREPGIVDPFWNVFHRNLFS